MTVSYTHLEVLSVRLDYADIGDADGRFTLAVGIEHSLDTGSYTHRDVYKRQVPCVAQAHVGADIGSSQVKHVGDGALEQFNVRRCTSALRQMV